MNEQMSLNIYQMSAKPPMLSWLNVLPFLPVAVLNLIHCDQAFPFPHGPPDEHQKPPKNHFHREERGLEEGIPSLSCPKYQESTKTSFWSSPSPLQGLTFHLYTGFYSTLASPGGFLSSISSLLHINLFPLFCLLSQTLNMTQPLLLSKLYYFSWCQLPFLPS